MTKALRCSICVALAVLAIAGPVVPASSAPPSQVEYLIKLSPSALADLAQELSAHSIEHWAPLDLPGWFRVSLPEDSLAHSLTRLTADPDLLAVQRDHRVHVALIPDDTFWGSQWAPTRVSAPAAWDTTIGRADVIIAVLDTGVDLDHADLANQLWVNAGEIPGNGIDDDGNGKVDDVNGWQFTHDLGGAPLQSNDVDDDHGHGTHVTGIAVATGNNGLGVAGMAWGCRAMAVKVLDQYGDGWESDVADALVYAVDNGAQIVNLSLGGTEDSPLMRDAVNYAETHGTLVVAAAGNTGSMVLYPAAYESAVAVAASDVYDQWASYSGYGPEIDVTAPGTSIWSTCIGDSYCGMSGTSMAAPHVAGLAALIWSHYPTSAAAQVRQRMIGSVQDLGSPGWDPYTGWGRIDAQRALAVPALSHRLYLPVATQRASLSLP